MLEGKKILFLCVQFFDYEIAVKQKLEELGAIVYYFDERPKNDLLTKAVLRINKNAVQSTTDKYFKKIYQSIENIRFDYLFVIKAEVTPKWFFEKFKQQNPQAELLLFLWDSIKNSNNALQVLDLFDKKYTFDFDDTKIHDLQFQPLFFVDSYAKLSEERDHQNELLFVGTAHTDRYNICKKVEEQCKNLDISYYFYYFLQSPYVFYHKKFFEEGFKNVKKEDITFTSLSTQATLQLYEKSKTILDIQHTRQTGLTMRTLETLGAGRKLITTNPRVKHYSFYHPDNVFIIDRSNPIIDLDFFTKEYSSVEEDVLYSYSIEGWIKSMFFPSSNSLRYLNAEEYEKENLKEVC